MKKSLVIIYLITIALIVIQSCKKDKTESDADKELYNEVNASGYTYYQSGNILPGVSPSPHGSFKLRFNAIASGSLDATGELPEGTSFPTGSILVKEVHSGNNISLFAVMKKDPSNANAANGWVWAEFNTDGSAAYSTGNRGSGCVSCHNGSPNRDLTMTFDLH